MEYRPLEITLLSADGIKNVNTFKKMDVYAVAFIFGYPQTRKKKTAVDRNCGTNPRWNQKLHFTIDERYLSYPGLTLIIKLKADKSFCRDINVGHVAVQLQELVKKLDRSGNADETVIEHKVRTSSGKSKGTIRISYKFGAKLSYNNSEIKKADEPVTAYPSQGYIQGQPGPAANAYLPHPGIMQYQQAPRGRYPGYAHPTIAAPPPQGYYGGYPPPGGQYQQPGYGYAPPPAYGYQQPMEASTKQKRKNGTGMGLGIGAGLLGGILLGDIV